MNIRIRRTTMDFPSTLSLETMRLQEAVESVQTNWVDCPTASIDAQVRSCFFRPVANLQYAYARFTGKFILHRIRCFSSGSSLNSWAACLRTHSPVECFYLRPRVLNMLHKLTITPFCFRAMVRMAGVGRTLSNICTARLKQEQQGT